MTFVLGNIVDFSVRILFITVVLIYIYRWMVRKLKYKLPPGPVGLPIVGCLPFLGKEPHKTIAKMKEKYGDIIGLKLGPHYTVVINEFNLAKEVLSHPATLTRSLAVFEGLPIGFANANGAEWQEQRKVCLHIMRNLGLGRGPWETLTKESAQEFVKELLSLKGQPAEIKSMIETVLSNNIISLLVGRRLNPKTEKEALKSVKDFSNVFRYFGPLVAGSLIPGYRKFCEYFRLFGYDKTKESISAFNSLLKNEVKKHRSDAYYDTVNDFINVYDEKKKQVQLQNNLHTFSDANLLGNMAALYLGGEDTISSSLTWLLRLMAKYPEIQKKVQAELDEVIGVDGAITYESRNNIPYTFAVMQEVQRFSTVVPLTTRRAAFDFEVRGYSIPEGTEISTNTWAIHNDPETFPNPSEFIPERFLPKAKTNADGDIPKIMAFSIGKRNCPGETVAWMVLLQFFTAVMQKFTISAPPGMTLNFEVTGGLIEHLGPQLLCFCERL